MTERAAAGEGLGMPAEDEFAGIPSTRYGRNPLVALAAIGVALYLAWGLRDRLAYYFASTAPVERTAASLVGPGAAPPLGRYARVTGVGERSAAVLIDT